MILKWGRLAILVLWTLSMSRQAFGVYEAEASSELLAPESKSGSLSYARLRGDIETFHLNSVESTLKHISEHYPRSFENYVMMYKSRSLQGASPESPRVLVLSDTRNMVLTFNGSEKQRGGDRIEVMEFDPAHSRFQFFEIDFSKNQNPGFSAANPTKCMNCHQASWRTALKENDPRPNWEPYNVWPGAFGSLDPNKSLSESRVVSSRIENHPLGEQLMRDQKKERDWMTRFERDLKPGHPRYQYLSDFDPGSARELTRRLAELNSLRLARILTKDKELYSLLRTSLGRLFNQVCQFTVLPLPPSKSKFVKPTWAPKPLSQELDGIFKPLGFRTEDWSMDFLTNGALASGGDRLANPHSSRAFMALAMAKHDPEIYDPINENFFGRGGSKGLASARTSCHELSQRARDNHHLSVASMVRIRDRVQQQNKKSFAQAVEKPLIHRCVSCHGAFSEDDAPFIPFGNEAELKEALRWEGYPRGILIDEIRYRLGPMAPSHVRMPRGAVPSLEQTESLLTKLQKLLATDL